MLVYMAIYFVGSFLAMFSLPGRGGYGPQDSAMFDLSIVILAIGIILGIIGIKGHRAEQKAVRA